MSEANRNFHILIVYHYALYHGIIIYTMLLECQYCVHLSHSSLVGWPTCWWIVWSSERPDKQLHSYCGEEIPATRNSVLFPDPERTPTKKVPRRQYDIWLGPMVLMSGMWDGQSEFSYIAFFFVSTKWTWIYWLMVTPLKVRAVSPEPFFSFRVWEWDHFGLGIILCL